MKNVLLLGLGFYGIHWYKTLKSMNNCRLTGICALKEDIDRLAKEYPISEAVFTDYSEAIEKADADIVVIVLPTPLHTIAARLALQKGLHVISEKPITFSIDDAEEIVKFKAAFPELKYMVSQNYRWRTHVQTLKRCIDSGMIGEINSILLEFRRPEDLIGYRTRLKMPLIQDVSIHHFDLIRFLTGSNCKELYAYSYRPVWSGFQGKSAAEIILEMENDITVNYSGTWCARGKETSWDGCFTISGSKGCLVTDSHDDVYLSKANGTKFEPVEKVKMEYTEQIYAINMFVKCIEEDKTPECSIEDNYNSFAMVCAAEESVLKHCPVKI